MKKFVAILVPLLFIPYAPSIEKGGTVILVYDGNPFYSLIAAPLSFHYGGIPAILFKNGITEQHKRFFDLYGANDFIVIGKQLGIGSKEFSGGPANVSFWVAKEFNAKEALLLPYDNYTLSLIATPIACYLDIPVLIYKNNNVEEIRKLCRTTGIEKIIVIGNATIGMDEIKLENENQIYDYIKSIKKIRYLAIANPHDVINNVENRTEIKMQGHISNLQFILFAIKFNIFGSNSINFNVDVPDGINHLKIFVNVSNNVSAVYATLYDSNGNMIAYSNSFAYMDGKCYLDALCINHSGKYRLNVRIYNGYLSGFFGQRGFSFVNADVDLGIIIEKLSSPHFPVLHISKISPLLACSHDGMVIAVDNDISKAYPSNFAGGPWINKEIQPAVNNLVNKSVEKIKRISEGTNAKWLAIVGDTNMIPMYYYNGSNKDAFVGYGIPSDNPYYLNFSIGVGRIVAFDDIDASLLIARSIFYSRIAHGDWLKKFNFIFGEGYGETGGLFHQVPYSKLVKGKGFHVQIYGDLRNDRSSLEENNAFEANYIEYEGHGDWFWMFANIYTNYFNNVDSNHVRNYEMYPSVVLTAACLMARVDGVPSNGNIGLAFIHAGTVAFIGATRETGKEAKLDWIENNLLFNDTSIGEAILSSKIKEEMPTKAARVLYGDPAFNPFEPE